MSLPRLNQLEHTLTLADMVICYSYLEFALLIRDLCDLQFAIEIPRPEIVSFEICNLRFEIPRSGYAVQTL